MAKPMAARMTSTLALAAPMITMSKSAILQQTAIFTRVNPKTPLLDQMTFQKRKRSLHIPWNGIESLSTWYALPLQNHRCKQWMPPRGRWWWWSCCHSHLWTLHGVVQLHQKGYDKSIHVKRMKFLLVSKENRGFVRLLVVNKEEVGTESFMFKVHEGKVQSLYSTLVGMVE